MNRLDTKIIIGGNIFTFCHEYEIESSFENLMDTARIVLPQRVRFRDPSTGETKNIQELFEIGQTAEIWGGYDGNLTKLFDGYVSAIRTKFPIEIFLEDGIFLLKRKTNSFSLKNAKLSTLINLIIPEGIEVVQTFEQNVGDWVINGGSSAEVLDELRKKHSIYSFFRDKKLYIGFSIVSSLQQEKTFEFQTPDVISLDNLDFRSEEEYNIKVVAKSIDSEGKLIKYETGNEGGDVGTFNFSGLTFEELKATAERKLEELRYSGYSGSFPTFLFKIVRHGDIVNLVNKVIPEQSGRYVINKVVYSGGVNGGRQEITIKRRI